MYEQIRYEVDGPMGLITLHRPEALNAWTDVMAREVRDAVGRAAADRDVVAIVITGAGRGFCAGADLGRLEDMAGGERSSPLAETLARGDAPQEIGDFDGTFSYLMATEKPVIAAINGAVAGMAYPFVLCCDLRFMSDDAVMLTAFAQRGLVAEFGLSWLLPRQVGPAVALDLLLSSRTIDGREAAQLGLVNASMPGDELLDHCRAYVQRLADTCSPASMAVMKRQVYEQLHRGLGAAEGDAFVHMAESFRRPDFTEGVMSFLEKRPPSFTRLPAEGS
ncbi:enoyl-CoA hydratase-related protein [Actinomarinicola tropica]|uniref:Enoyl-CoA hydratase n=1 Tax=Actinomarinicola tropica TaxID=2789776 RepID=A0A5Q2RKG7_9ACTN|nr:enoyl-CoA hydratase-related protein [Actinomarinicola tropica]QGG93695.1 enoyl-CoA hydratase [Actinomarinicola tropica]